MSDFTEPLKAGAVAPTGLSALSPNDTETWQPLHAIRNLPEPMRATMIELIGHLALVGQPLAAMVRGHCPSPRLYQTLLHAIMEHRTVTHTTVDAHRLLRNRATMDNHRSP